MANFRYLRTFIDEQSHGGFLARSKSWPQLGGHTKSIEEELEAEAFAYVAELQNRCILTFGPQQQTLHPQVLPNPVPEPAEPEPPETSVQEPAEVLSDNAQNAAVGVQDPNPSNPGSRGHPALCHRPCVRFAKGTCEMGDACAYCHFAGHARLVHPDKRQRDQLQKMATWLA
eukprot:Skav204502  [mRNA]  locus=scaffold527:85807:86322:+ [translate_table: standard]